MRWIALTTCLMAIPLLRADDPSYQRDVRPTFLRNVRLPPLSSAAIMQIMECLRYQRFHEVAQGPGQELEIRAGDYLMRLIEVVNFD